MKSNSLEKKINLESKNIGATLRPKEIALTDSMCFLSIPLLKTNGF